MKSLLRFLPLILALSAALPALADDQQKAEKQVNKVTAMATDATGRRVVSMTVSDLLNMKRSDVVQERRETGLNYGHLFIAHQLTVNGAKMSDIAEQLKVSRPTVREALIAGGFDCPPSHANFVLVQVDEPGRDRVLLIDLKTASSITRWSYRGLDWCEGNGIFAGGSMNMLAGWRSRASRSWM